MGNNLPLILIIIAILIKSLLLLKQRIYNKKMRRIMIETMHSRQRNAKITINKDLLGSLQQKEPRP